jgi:hypothetical protein
MRCIVQDRLNQLMIMEEDVILSRVPPTILEGEGQRMA